MAGESAQTSEERAAELLRGVGSTQRAAKLVMGRLLRRFFSMEVVGDEHVPATGPVVLAPSHESMWDVPLLVVASPRPIVFMAKSAVFDRLPKRLFFGSLGGFPVERGSQDLEAMKKALAVVRAGRVLCMYPEGTRNFGKELLPFLPGAAWIALAEGAPLVPVGIRGVAGIWPRGARYPRRSRVRIAFGEPVEWGRERVPRTRRRKAVLLTEELRERVAGLR